MNKNRPLTLEELDTLKKEYHVFQRGDFILYRGESFLSNFDNYYYGKNSEGNHKYFNEKKNRLSKDSPTYRVVSHWEDCGLIESDRPNGTGWRTYSLLEVIWVHIIVALRNFSFPLEKIAEVKDKFNNIFVVHDSKKSFELLEFYTAIAIAMKIPINILVFDNCKVEIGTIDEIETSIKLGLIKNNYICINLNAILQKLNPKGNLAPAYGVRIALTNDEIDIILMLRTGNFTSLNIIKNNGKVDRIEATEYLEKPEKINAILAGEKYQRLEIVQTDGKVRAIKRTLIKKFTNGTQP